MCGDTLLWWQLHIITIHKAQHVVVIMRNRELSALKLQCSQRKNVLGKAWVMIRYAHTASYDIST